MFTFLQPHLRFGRMNHNSFMLTVKFWINRAGLSVLAVLSLGAGQGQGASPGGGSGDDGTMLIVWAVLLIGAAIALFMVELFIPSGGIIGLMAGIALVAGIVMLFLNNTMVGLIGAAVTLVSLPFLIGFALKIWPDTPIGRLFVLEEGSSKAAGGGTSSEGGPGGEGVQSTEQGTGILAGAEGKALTDLHPVGTCLLHGQREQCLASGSQIDAGQLVRVVSVDGMQIKVRALTSR